MISAKPENATVVPPITYAVEGIAAYGVTTAKFEAPVVVIRGDVNGDGEVTAADVTLLYNIMLSDDWDGAVYPDQNGDGEVTSADVTAVYNVLLGIN